jgi:hypothetical protein
MSTPRHWIRQHRTCDTTGLTHPKHVDASCHRDLQSKKETKHHYILYIILFIYIYSWGIYCSSVCVCVYIQYVCKYANKASPPQKIEHMKAGKDWGHISSEPSWKPSRSHWRNLSWAPPQIARKEHHQRARRQRARCRWCKSVSGGTPKEPQMSAALLGKSLGTLW